MFELLGRPATPARVAVSEYVDLADAFFAAAEKGMTNAVLDTVARRLRSGEFAESGGPADARAATAG